MTSLSEIFAVGLGVVIILMVISEHFRSREAHQGSVEAQALIDRAKQQLKDFQRETERHIEEMECLKCTLDIGK